MVKHFNIRWGVGKESRRPSVRQLEFCCPAMAENWNRITQFAYHHPSGKYEVVNRTELSAATLQAAAISHAAAVTAEEATGMCDGDFDYDGTVDYSRVFPWTGCPHCGAKIVIEQVNEEGGESA